MSSPASGPDSPRRDNDLVARIVESVQAEPVTRHLDAHRLPSRDVVVEVIRLFRELLFPGYFGKQDLTTGKLQLHVARLLADIHERLVPQVHHALLHEAARLGNPTAGTQSDAEAVVADLLADVPRLRAVLATDVKAAFAGDPAAAGTDEIIFSYPGLFAIGVHRLAHELLLRRVPLIPRIMAEYAHGVTGVDIHPGATIGDHFFIDHGTGVVIGETTHIGRGVKIYQNVTLGALSTRGGQSLRGVKRHPTLEDDVTVYASASILGGDTVIGRGAVIAGNVFITKSVPPGTRVTVKSPELQYRDQSPREFRQEFPADWVI